MSGRRGWLKRSDSTPKLEAPSPSALAPQLDLKRASVMGQNLLRRDDATQRVPAREHDAAMVNLGSWTRWLTIGGTAIALLQCAAAGRAPVRLSFGGKLCMAMAANTFHSKTILLCARQRAARPPHRRWPVH